MSSTPGTARIFSRYASGIITPNDTLWRVNRRFADSGVVGGFSSSSSNVFNVLIRKSDMVMLSTVKIVLLRLHDIPEYETQISHGVNSSIIPPLPEPRCRKRLALHGDLVKPK